MEFIPCNKNTQFYLNTISQWKRIALANGAQMPRILSEGKISFNLQEFFEVVSWQRLFDGEQYSFWRANCCYSYGQFFEGNWGFKFFDWIISMKDYSNASECISNSSEIKEVCFKTYYCMTLSSVEYARE